jgi:hypothetical protein
MSVWIIEPLATHCSPIPELQHALLPLEVVATLTLGLWPKQMLMKVQAKYEARESHFMLSGVQESVREWTFTLASELLF